MNELNQWYRTSSLAKLLKQAEQQALSRLFQTIFGYHLILTGSADVDLVASSRIRQHTIVTPDPLPAEQNPTQTKLVITGLPEQLPIQTDCVDAMVLFHTLDFSLDPHAVLREAERVLVPEGHVIIVGFNPVSFWGLTRAAMLLSKRVPWRGKFKTTSRIKDWVGLLGFEFVSMEKVFFRPPIQHDKTLSKLEFMEKAGAKLWPYFGASYVLTARKKVSTVTPIRPRWRPRKAVAPGLIDSARHSNKRES